MKKHFYQLGKQVLSLSVVIASTLLFSNQVSAQGVSINGTGTGTAPDASAILDLNVSGLTPKKGFLAPRVALTGSGDATTITSPATSLIVYNTATGGGVSPGFYYNSGTPGAPSWVSIGGSGSAPTAGNDINVSGTQVDVEPILNYVNTITSTDGGGTGVASDLTILGPAFQNLILGAGGSERARFLSTGNFGVGDATPASLFTVGNLDLFQVNSSGNLIAINGLTGYSWPAAHASGVLKNNGTGTLTWGPPIISGVAPLTNNNIWIGVGGVATERTMSGDGTLADNGSNAVLTISDNAVDGTDIALGTQNTNDVMQYNGTDWVAVAPSTLPIVTSFSAINTGLTPNAATTGAVVLAGTLDVDNGGTGTSTAFTPGSVVFAGASGIYTQDNPNFFWDNTNDRLGIGTAAAPAYKLDVNGAIRTGQNGLDGQLLIYSEQGGTDYTYTINPNAAATQNVVLTLPADDGGANQVLATDGSGALSWSTPFINPMTTWGDIIYGGQTTAGVPTRLGAGTAGMTFHTNGVGAAPSWSVIDLDNNPNAEVGGILGVGNGGTGVANPTANGILVGNGSSPVASLTGTNMQTLRFNATPAPVASSNLLNNDITIGMGGLTTAEVTASSAKLDIDGDNASTTSLRLRSGNPNVGSGATQIAFGYNGTSTYEHLIKTRHASGVGQNASNAMEFWISLTGGTAVRTAMFDGQGGLSLNSENTAFVTRIVPTVNQTQNYTIMLPNTVSAPGQGLVATDANGTLAWTTVGSGSVTSITPGTGIVGSANITTTGTIAVDAGNGLTADAGEDKVELGGTLDENTTIAQGNFNMIHNLTGTGDFDVQVAGSTQFIVDAATGNVGIGGTAVTHKLTINGKVKSTGINETSDARLKTNFASIDGALNKILSMNGKYYDWRISEFPNKGLEKGRQVGVIAQEIEKILPEVVDTDSEGYKSVEYGHIVPVLIEAIKEQQKIIDGQNSTITDLKASLENVLNRVNIIEKNTDLNSSKVQK
jgi:hypothetical protein